MIIESLRLKGFTGIRRGMGLDEIVIDFNNVSGLIAFDGPNGVGKSTIIENMAAYNQLASRDGALHRHVCRRDAEKELCFSYQGHKYRTLLKIDCESEKSEGYIWIDGKSAVNGKISAYAKYMKDLMGSPDLFYNSVFCSQNAKKLSEMTTGKLKELFSEFLRLDKLQAYENTAKQCAAVLNGKLAQADAQIAALALKLQGREELAASLVLTEGMTETLISKKISLSFGLKEMGEQIAAMKERAAKYDALRQRLADVKAMIESVTATAAREKEAADKEMLAMKSAYMNASLDISTCRIVIDKGEEIRRAAARAQEVRCYIETLTQDADGNAVKINALQNVIHGLEQEIQGLKQQIMSFDNDAEIRGYDAKAGDIGLRLSELDRVKQDLANDRESHDLVAKINRCREQMAALEVKDPSCVSTTCSFIIGALAARDELPVFERQLEDRRDYIESVKQEKAMMAEELKNDLAINAGKRAERCEQIEAEKSRLDGEIKSRERNLQAEKLILIQLNDGATTIRQNIARARLELSDLKDLADQESELMVATARKADLEARRAELIEAGKRARKAYERNQALREAEIRELNEKLAEINAEIDSEVEGKLNRAIAEMTDTENRIAALDEEIAKGRNEVARLKAEVERMYETEKELETARHSRDLLARNASEWTYLKNACGKSGLQALEIDGAAPIITGYANHLLSMAFGPLFTVKFRTQDEEGREVLDIVTIGEDGDEILLENLSGGQRIWILMALRLAMTLLSKEKSGRNFETFFADELDGPLDPENSINFVNMYQAFMKIGGFKAGYFISHKPSCRALADNILKFEPGKNPVWG